jgi:YVTN family beta-propeller protein
VANQGNSTVSVINTTTNTVTATVPVGNSPVGVAVSPDGTNVYVTNNGANTVSVISTTTNTATATVNVGSGSDPLGVAVTPNGANVYVANGGIGTVSVINTATNTVTAPVNVGNIPRAFGQFIGKAIPTITWSNPTNITYGTALSETQLDATASVPGNFAYNPEAETVLSAGLNQQLNTTFTPTDTQNYTTATDIVYINVTKATPTINWNNPANMTYGTALSNIQLDATSPESGTFAYNPVTGTVLSADLNQQLNTTFTPSGNDAVNYTTASATVFINVTPATPAITWSNPDDIVYGTALSDTQLDAKGSVPGIFVYTPSSGTILNAGTQTLDVSFTPNDAINYTTASASVTMNVLTPTPKIILSPTQKIQQMIAFIQGITTSGELDEGSSIELTAILQAAEKNIDRNPFAEPAELRYFITDVKDKIDLGVLSQTNGQTLIDAANDIINSLRNQGR